MTKTTNRLKTKAQAYAPQTKADCQADIKRLGDLQRDLQRASADLNDEVARATKAATPRLEDLQARITTLQVGIQIWCEAHREELCGKGKTANLITGVVSWRQRPPSVAIRGVDLVLETLTRMGLGRFIRTKTEPNKEAMLAEPAALAGIAGIAISTGVEDFEIRPAEVDTESV